MNEEAYAAQKAATETRPGTMTAMIQLHLTDGRRVSINVDHIESVCEADSESNNGQTLISPGNDESPYVVREHENTVLAKLAELGVTFR